MTPRFQHRIGHKWTGTRLHAAAIVGTPALVSLLLKHGADPNADTGFEHHSYNPGFGPSALDSALDTHQFLWKARRIGKGDFERTGLVDEHGAEVEGKARHLDLSQVCRSEGFSTLWEKLREGIGKGEGEWIMCNDLTLSILGDDSDVGDSNEKGGSSYHDHSRDGDTELGADLTPILVPRK